jgi:hypothetical protein
MRGGILFTREFRPSKKHKISKEAISESKFLEQCK